MSSSISMCGFYWLCTNSPAKYRILSPPPIWSPPPPLYIIATNTNASEYDRRYHRRHRIWSPPLPTPPYMIATTTSVYYCHHCRRLCILLPPLLTSPYIIATTISVYYRHHFRHLRILPPYIAYVYYCHHHWHLRTYIIITTTNAFPTQDSWLCWGAISPTKSRPTQESILLCCGVEFVSR